MDLSAFHFLRPWWLGGVLAAIFLWWLWRAVAGRQLRDSRIAPALLPYLLVHAPGGRGPRPIDILAAILVLAAVAAAGPVWQRDEPDFLDNVAPLIVALDLSPSMDGTDVPPSRLEAAKQMARDVAARRAGSKTGLIAYAGSSHLVLPPTDDKDLLDLFIQALSSDLIATGGHDAAGTIALGARVLAAERTGGTLLLLTDGVDPTQLTAVRQNAQAARDMQVLVMAVGQRAGASGQGNSGSGVDESALRELARAAGAPLGSLTRGSDDLDWITLHAQQHFLSVQDARAGTPHWKEAGYWLCWPLAILALVALRRGGRVTWHACLVAGVMMIAPPQASNAAELGSTIAATVTDMFLTADQQGRMAFQRGDYAAAVAHFQDPYWKGRAAYAAGNYPVALQAFGALTTAEGYFYAGNTQTRLRHYDAALAAYDQALAVRPAWEPAVVNRGIVARLLAAMTQEDEGAQSEPADKTIEDKTAQAGKMVATQTRQAASEETWLNNLTVSPARFLRGKFAAPDAAKDVTRDAARNGAQDTARDAVQNAAQDAAQNAAGGRP
ncbi:VWA domain-containing protein [Bordetella sp. N]|uniref:VWA domain-containing protein n=1 Tax=Bordetella sp. N TaxID=1746199 RepID=UPI0009E6803E|nr:VWA domain-containing protein [Bordetella sp. N]